MRPLLFLDEAVFGSQSYTHVHCVKCARSYYVRFLASAKSLSPFKFMSVIHSTETASWLLNVIARFRLESVFCCCAFRKRFPSLGQLFLIIFFHLGCLPHRTLHYSSSVYMDLHTPSFLTPHLGLPLPPELLWSPRASPLELGH